MTEEINFTSRRTSNIAWKDFFMNVAILSSERSKDPSSQVGACVVSSDNIIIGTGYNGLPRGLDDDTFNWSRESTNPYTETKYPYVCHAEMNAICNCHQLSNLQGSILYTTLFPCNECAKIIIQKGIKKVIYLEHKYPDVDSFIVSKKMLETCGVEMEIYEGEIAVSRKN